jgi:hypothetical protein
MQGDGDDRLRLLVLAGAAVDAPDLEKGIGEHTGDRQIEVHVVAPALAQTALRHGMGDVDEAIESAKRRLRQSMQQIERAGIPATGSVGESDPQLAIADALQTFPADRILIVTHPDAESTWLEKAAFERAQEEFSQPITHLVVEQRNGDRTVTEVESAGEGVTPSGPRERRGFSRNMPPLTLRDLGGIAVAMLGTLILVILAASCDHGDGISGGCAVRLLIAGGVGLISLAHVVGLLLFESVRYHGLFERFFAYLVLFGIPVAIAVSLVVG